MLVFDSASRVRVTVLPGVVPATRVRTHDPSSVPWVTVPVTVHPVGAVKVAVRAVVTTSTRRSVERTDAGTVTEGRAVDESDVAVAHHSGPVGVVESVTVTSRVTVSVAPLSSVTVRVTS